MDKFSYGQPEEQYYSSGENTSENEDVIELFQKILNEENSHPNQSNSVDLKISKKLLEKKTKAD